MSVFALVLAGCGSSQPAKTDDTAASTDTAATTTDAGYKLIKEGKLISVSDMECPPFSSYKDGTSEPEGFEIDLMDAIAKKMGLECEWLPKMDFDAIIPLIQQGGKADVSCANFSITPERQEVIDFTDPYYEANIAFVIKGDREATSTEDFNKEGIRIGCQAGTTGEDWAKEHLPNAEIVNMAPATAMLSVQSGGEGSDSLDAMVCDLPVANGLISKSYTDLKVLDAIAVGDNFGIVVSKDNPELTKALNKALQELKADGTIDALVEKWLASGE